MAVFDALLATLFTWGLTAVGAAAVFLVPDAAKTKSTGTLRQKILDGSLGFAGGVMLATSFMSLVQPAIELSAPAYGATFAFIPAVVGFLVGGAFVWAGDAYGPTDDIAAYLQLDNPRTGKLKDDDGDAAGLGSPMWTNSGEQVRRRIKPPVSLTSAEAGVGAPHTPRPDEQRAADRHRVTLRRLLLLIFAVTVHNIPEGAAAGIAMMGKSTAAGWRLAIAIGLQNAPEGLSVSLPLHAAGMSKSRAFFWGQLSGAVEPVAGVAGALLVAACEWLLPYAMGFAAGAMVYVVCESVIPEAHASGANSTLASWGVMLGCSAMMVLESALG